MCAHLVHSIHAFRQPQYDRSVWCWLIRGIPCGPMNVEMLKLGTTYYHVKRWWRKRSALYIPLEVVFAWRLNCRTVEPKISSLPTFFENDFCVMGRTLIIYVLEFSVEAIFNHIVLFFRSGVSTNYSNIVEFCKLWLLFRSQVWTQRQSGEVSF